MPHPAPASSARRPGLLLLSTEPWCAAAECVAWKVLPARAAASGDGHPVIFFPDLASNGRALTPLRSPGMPGGTGDRYSTRCGNFC